jgi:hypothetical protein
MPPDSTTWLSVAPTLVFLVDPPDDTTCTSWSSSTVCSGERDY